MMSAGAGGGAMDWAQEIARIATRIEELRAWSEQECRLVQANIDAQILDLRSDLKRLKNEVSVAGPDAFALQIAAQIEELKRKGDLAYQRLSENLAGAETSTGT